MSCKPHTKLASDCTCLMKLQQDDQVLVLNLKGATVRPLLDNNKVEIGFNIQTLKAGANILAAGSNFTRADVEADICDCNTSSGGGGGTPVVATDTICSYREVLTNSTWSPPAETQSFSYFVKTIAGSPPTISDAAANVTNLYLGEAGSYSILVDRDIAMSLTFTITANAGDEIIINYTTVCP